MRYRAGKYRVRGSRYILGSLIFAAVLSSASALHAAHEGLMHPMDVFEEITRIGSTTGMSIAPVLAYEPTFGLIYGGAVFLEKEFAPEYSFNGRLAFSTEGEYSALAKIIKNFGPQKYYHLELEVDDFARPYYGEGMNTSASDEIMLEGTVTRFLYFLNNHASGELTWGPFLEFRGVDDDGAEGNDLVPPEYEEASLGVGLGLVYDGRDSDLSPTSGIFDMLTLRLVTDSMTSYEGSHTFFQVEVDHRNFTSLSDGFVLAGRIHLGVSSGTPSYQYRYSLGGPYELRGFLVNRFRGKHFYNLQGEVRKDLFWIFSGAAFAELGEVTDDRFNSPETSVGAGFRMTLPPDHIAKVRMDFAWAKDQQAIYFIFGEAF